MWYTGYEGDNHNAENRASGAYIFRPLEAEPNAISDAVETEVYEGDLFWEVRTVYADFASQVARIYK